ncbi:hypothetical protein DCCM_4045 [Desulfocucumis palustris]|uniref:Uncharacterized protein n=1 Tax=Desulfocucumis palustris TaxID=1898651 RepID=A0A2L2XFC0_9FIRM|nr:hypothetical protein DCCM_4045 [Desulfocucumis palustris]
MLCGLAANDNLFNIYTIAKYQYLICIQLQRQLYKTGIYFPNQSHIIDKFFTKYFNIFVKIILFTNIFIF